MVAVFMSSRVPPARPAGNKARQMGSAAVSLPEIAHHKPLWPRLAKENQE
jgi:hypothetical protein